MDAIIANRSPKTHNNKDVFPFLGLLLYLFFIIFFLTACKLRENSAIFQYLLVFLSPAEIPVRVFARFCLVRSMILNIVKAFCVGICASVPLGPIAIMVIQKSLGKGVKSGFMTGAGAGLADTVYAVIALFFLAIAQDLMEKYSAEILIAGGIVIAIIGVLLAVSNPFRKTDQIDKVDKVSSKDFFQGLLMALSNPGAILIMFGLLASFGIDLSGGKWWNVVMVIIALSIGSLVYWFTVSWSLSRFRSRFKMRTLVWINRVAGWIIAGIGIIMFGAGLYEMLFHESILP